MNRIESDRHQVMQDDLRWSWALRVMGLAHLALVISWFFTDASLISEEGIFKEVASSLPYPLDLSAAVLWLCSAIGLLVGRYQRISLLVVSIGSALTLSQLPVELLHTQDRLLLILSLICALLPNDKRARQSLARLSMAMLFAIWAWPSIFTAFKHPLNLWTNGNVLSFWGWTSASPTPLASVLAVTPHWLRECVCSLTLAWLAWGPVIAILRIRLWPLVWLFITPLCLWIGGGIPTVIGSAIWLVCTISLDERVRRSPVSKLTLHPLSQKLSPYAVLKWPVCTAFFWYMLSENQGSAPLIVIAMYLLWTPPMSKEAERSGALITMSSCMLLLVIILFSSGHFDDQKASTQSLINRLSVLRLSEIDTQWTQVAKSRTSIKLERSEDGGASWQAEGYHAADSVALDLQPWRPLSPLRESKWLDRMLNNQLCEEGPLMELFEDRLRSIIKDLNSPPRLTPHQLILLRARRVEWVRSGHGFWREEARGFYCIPTNLVILLKARQLIKQSRETLPSMPKLAPDPRQVKP